MKPLATAIAALVLASPALPCSAFLATGWGRILFGNNEDFWNPNTRVWFVPATEGRRGVMYLGFDNGFRFVRHQDDLAVILPGFARDIGGGERFELPPDLDFGLFG